MIIGIYKITNKINTKIYVGQSWDIEKRWKKHKALNGHSTHLYSSIKKYGIENFEFEIIMEFKYGPFTQKYLDKFEDYYINFYDSMNNKKGYNKKSGGSNGRISEETKIKISISETGKKDSEETKLKKKISKTREKNPAYGIPTSIKQKETTSTRMKGNSYSSIEIINLETKEVFDSIKKAEIKYNTSHICNCCNDLSRTAGGFHFMYLKDYDENKDYIFISTIKIEVINLDTLETFNSITEAENKHNISHISEVCEGKLKTSGGFRWMYLKYYDINKEYDKPIGLTYSKSVICLETKVVYASLIEAKRKTGISDATIGLVCKNKYQQAGGFHWQYYSDYLKLHLDNNK